MSGRAAMQVSVVIPTFNEAGSIVEVVERVQRVLGGWRYEIVVVDDDSPDGTWGLVRERFRGDGRVRVLRRLGERGLVSAVLEGMASSYGAAIAVMDGDLQHDEAILPTMVGIVSDGRADICIGTRFAGNKERSDRSLPRRVLTKVGATLARLALPALHLTSDPLSGYFVLERDLYESAASGWGQQRWGRGYKVLWVFVAQSGPDLTVEEVPYRLRPRMAGTTKLSGVVLGADLVAAWRLRRAQPPIPKQGTRTR